MMSCVVPLTNRPYTTVPSRRVSRAAESTGGKSASKASMAYFRIGSLRGNWCNRGATCESALRGRTFAPRLPQFRRRLVAPQLQDQVHHQPLDVIAHVAVVLVLQPHAGLDVPLPHRALDRRRQRLAAHVDQEVEHHPAQVPYALTRVNENFDP